MARKTSEELQEIMKKEGCDRIWSWSKVNCFHTSPYEYFLKYIKHIEEDRKDAIYVVTGGIAHDILERYYTGQLEYDKMAEDFDDGWITAVDVAGMKFDRNSSEKNDKIAQKYYENILHFFNHHTPFENKPMIEQFVTAKIGDNLFQGYIDACFKDKDKNVHIIDFKTSTIYTGDKALNECGQLVLYAIGLSQHGIPLDKIKIAWNFLKYVSIQYQQKNGEIKTRNVERCKIGESLQANAKTWLKAGGYDVDDYLKQMIVTNGIECLPQDIQDKYKISDCYVYVDITDELIDKWQDYIITTINDIELREKDYEETENDVAFFDTDESVEKQSYYFATLCGYSPMLHKPFQKYLERLEAKNNGADMFNGIGSDTETESVDLGNKKTNKDIQKKDDEVDLSWLDSVM